MPIPVPRLDVIKFDIGCDLCVQPGQLVNSTTLDCKPDTRRQPTFCTLRNPDGLTVRELDDKMSINATDNQVIIDGLVRNPEDPAPPTVLGDWTCTCVNDNGVSTATSRIGECRELVSF